MNLAIVSCILHTGLYFKNQELTKTKIINTDIAQLTTTAQAMSYCTISTYTNGKKQCHIIPIRGNNLSRLVHNTKNLINFTTTTTKVSSELHVYI